MKNNNKKINHTITNNGVLMNRKMVFLVVAICAMVLFGTTSAFAAGTPAGTVIKNVASMTYKDLAGTSFPTLYSDTASVTVEQVASVTLTSPVELQYSADSMYIYFPMTVTNTGNGTDNFTLARADSGSWTPLIFFDANSDGILQAGETTNPAATGNIAADATYKIIVRLFVPFGTTSGKLDTIRTTATSQFVGPDPIASAFAKDSIRTRTADVGLTKTNNNGTPQPGQTITYTINYSNTGTGTAKSSTLSDTIGANVTYVAASATIVSGGGTVAFLTSPNRVVWSNMGGAGNVYAGMTGSMTFSVTVNANVPAGTTISNRATMDYTDSISGHTENPPGGPSTSTVASTGAWDIKVEVAGGSTFGVDNKTDSVDVSQIKFYRIQLTNLGNRTDTASFAKSSTIPLTWTFYQDVDSSGTSNGGDLLNPANTGPIVQGGRKYFLAYDTVGQSVTNRSLDSAKYIATSLFLGAKDTGYTYTRIKAPVMTLTKAVGYQSATWGGGNRIRPGDTLIYTITYTNTGSGDANQIVISDASPTNTAYVTGSVQLNNSATGNVFTAKTDASDADEIAVATGTITATLGTVGDTLNGDATRTGQIRFKVKIN